MASSRFLCFSSRAASYLRISGSTRSFSSASDLRISGLSRKPLSNLSMASYRLVCSSSRAPSYSTRPFSSVIKAHKNEAHDAEPTIGKGKFEEEQLGEEMKNLFDDATKSSDQEEKLYLREIIKSPEVEIGLIRVDGSPKEEIGIVVQFRVIFSDGRLAVGSNLYAAEKDVEGTNNRRHLKSFAFMVDAENGTVVPIIGKCPI